MKSSQWLQINHPFVEEYRATVKNVLNRSLSDVVKVTHIELSTVILESMIDSAKERIYIYASDIHCECLTEIVMSALEDAFSRGVDVLLIGSEKEPTYVSDYITRIPKQNGNIYLLMEVDGKAIFYIHGINNQAGYFSANKPKSAKIIDDLIFALRNQEI